jgi:hypothetical protein
MANLPVRAMVLYKHGVGFFIRQGEVKGEKVQLTFRSDEINDVLKSLAVFDQSGGQVLGIHYQTPMDRAARLASSSIRLSQVSSLRDLIRDLRGRDCLLVFEIIAGTEETVVGRVIGLDEVKTQEEFQANISILTEQGVRVFRYDSLRSIRIKDEQSAHDLTYFLDTSMAEDDRRVVTVRLSEGDHDLAVYYVAPSPTWRVSYRLIAESDENGSTGKALLQGWGLFDNRLEEDLDNVRVTLVAGQPISFIYELYASRIPLRPTVQDESRIAPGPIEFEGAEMGFGGTMMADAAEETSQKRRRGAALLGKMDTQVSSMQHYAQAAAAPAPKLSREMATSSAQAQSEAKDTGETFQYVVTAPVSVKRGESALVPIIAVEVNYERELLYNAQKLPNHPVVSLRFDNLTGLTLERGPVTVVEDGDYKGEAVIPFTKEHNQVYVPYAVELGIKVTEHQYNENVVSGIKIENGFLWEQVYLINEVTYIIDNSSSKPQTVTIEAAIHAKYELFETLQPDIETTNERRWKISIDARGKAEFIRKQRLMRYDRREIHNLDYQKLSEYLEKKWLEKSTYDELWAILELVHQIRKEEIKINKQSQERSNIYQQQEQLRANLGALQPTGQEANLRNRLLKQLETTQDRLDEIEKAIIEANQFIEAGNKRVQQLIAELV